MLWYLEFLMHAVYINGFLFIWKSWMNKHSVAAHLHQQKSSYQNEFSITWKCTQGTLKCLSLNWQRTRQRKRKRGETLSGGDDITCPCTLSERTNQVWLPLHQPRRKTSMVPKFLSQCLDSKQICHALLQGVLTLFPVAWLHTFQAHMQFIQPWINPDVHKDKWLMNAITGRSLTNIWQSTFTTSWLAQHELHM